MKLMFSALEQVEQLDFPETSSMSEVNSILTAVFPALASMPGFVWVCDGKVFKPQQGSTLKQLGLSENSLISLQPAQSARPRNASSSLLQQPPAKLRKQRHATYFPGMGFNEVLAYNPNPVIAAQVLRAHPELLREMSFHHAQLAQRIQTAASDAEAGDILREIILASEVARSMDQFEKEQTDQDMRQRLERNAQDEEAIKYFKRKDNQALLKQQSDLVMQEYPETLFPVLMLYIETEINQVPVKAFVDSGAQTSVMTLACAERCGIDHLIDERFASKIVGVGQSSSLGKIMICPIKIGTTYFQMSVTVMRELGDKAMDFLFGLDMLKRHKFVIDLELGELRYHGANGVDSTPFLHEKDLPVNRGGTQGIQIDEHGIQVGQEEEEEEDKKKAQATTSSSNEEEEEGMVLDQDKIKMLTDMGYDRERVIRVLIEQDWDVDTAQTCLMFEATPSKQQ